jgi:hypothetical protein
MAEEVLCQFQIASLVIDQTGCRMPECAKACRSLRPGNMQAVENRVKNTFSKNILIEEIPIRLAKNEISRLIVPRSPSKVITSRKPVYREFEFKFRTPDMVTLNFVRFFKEPIVKYGLICRNRNSSMKKSGQFLRRTHVRKINKLSIKSRPCQEF